MLPLALEKTAVAGAWFFNVASVASHYVHRSVLWATAPVTVFAGTIHSTTSAGRRLLQAV